MGLNEIIETTAKAVYEARVALKPGHKMPAWEGLPEAMREYMKLVATGDKRDHVGTLRTYAHGVDEEGWHSTGNVMNRAADFLEEMQMALFDPIAVHTNMLTGAIAKPSAANIVHLYGREALLKALS